MRRVRRIVLIVLAVLALSFMALEWLFFAPHTPELDPTKAAAIIATTPEFNRSFSLRRVLSTTRGSDSLKDSLYNAAFLFVAKELALTPDFKFVPAESTTPIKGIAEFRWWRGKWHLSSFSGSSTKDKTVSVSIESDGFPDSN